MISKEISDAILHILQRLNLTEPARVWLCNALGELGVELARTPGSTASEELVRAILGRNQPKRLLSSHQREELFWLLLSSDEERIGRCRLFARNSI